MVEFHHPVKFFLKVLIQIPHVSFNNTVNIDDGFTVLVSCLGPQEFILDLQHLDGVCPIANILSTD